MRDSYDEAVHYRGGHDPNIVRAGKTETIARRVASLLAMAFWAGPRRQYRLSCYCLLYTSDAADE